MRGSTSITASTAMCSSLTGDGKSLRQRAAHHPVLEITGGSDLAEPFAVMDDATVEPGTLMVIDEANPGHLRVSTDAYDSSVAGIVSGAGDVKPGVTLRQEGVMEGDALVAIAGRVYVKAEALSAAVAARRPAHHVRDPRPRHEGGGPRPGAGRGHRQGHDRVGRGPGAGVGPGQPAIGRGGRYEPLTHAHGAGCSCVALALMLSHRVRLAQRRQAAARQEASPRARSARPSRPGSGMSRRTRVPTPSSSGWSRIVAGETVAYIAHLTGGGFCIAGADRLVFPSISIARAGLRPDQPGPGVDPGRDCGRLAWDREPSQRADAASESLQALFSERPPSGTRSSPGRRRRAPAAPESRRPRLRCWSCPSRRRGTRVHPTTTSSRISPRRGRACGDWLQCHCHRADHVLLEVAGHRRRRRFGDIRVPLSDRLGFGAAGIVPNHSERLRRPAVI